MKPKNGREVFVIYHGAIYKEVIYALGKDFFVVGSTFDTGKCDDYRCRVYYYNHYNHTWFTEISKAKSALLNDYRVLYGDAVELAKHGDSSDAYWEIRFKEKKQ